MSFQIYLLLTLISPLLLSNTKRFLEYNNMKLTRELEEKDTKLVNVRCFFVNKTNVYSFENLQEDEDRQTEINGGKIYYNFCQNLHKTCGGENALEQSSTLIYEDGQKCYRLSGPIEGINMEKNIWKETTIKKDGVEMKGLRLDMASGDPCTKNENYKTSYELICNPSKGEGYVSIDFSTLDVKKCKNVFVGEAYDACSLKNTYRLQQFFQENKIIIGFIVIAIGTFYLIFGVFILKPSLIALFGFIVAIFVNLIIYSFFTIEKELTFWICILVPFVIGCSIGFFVIRLIKLAYFAAGAACGYVIGSLLYNVLAKYITWNPNIVYWGILILCMIIFGMIGLWFLKITLIISTSIIGGYCIIKGASLFFGGFPDEKQIFDLVRHKEWEQLQNMINDNVFIYFGIWLLLFVIGVIVQFKLNRGKDNNYFRNLGRKDNQTDYQKI